MQRPRNTWNLIGRLGADPEVETIEKLDNAKVCNFSIAVTDNNNKEETSWIDCIAWRSTAEFIGKYFKKGSQIALLGWGKQERWETTEGEKRSRIKFQVDAVDFVGSASSTKDGETEATDGDDFPF